MPETEVDFDAAYRIGSWGDIAWRLLGYAMIQDEDYEWSGIEYENRERVRAYMVGDDQVFTFEVEELTKIDDEEYCSKCGQIGCTADGR